MAGPFPHIASQFRQAGPTDNDTHSDDLHELAHSRQTSLDIWQQLRQHHQYTEFRTQIALYLTAEDDIWYCLCLLRIDHGAHDLVYSIAPSILLVPPHGIWNLIVNLRSSEGWKACREAIRAQLSHEPIQASGSYSSARTSYGSHQRAAHLSAVSAQSSRFSSASSNSALSYVQVEPENIVRPRLQTNMAAHNKPLPQDPSIQPQAIKAHRKGKAPDGTWYECPYPQCRGRDGFKRHGMYESHMILKHQVSADQVTQGCPQTSSAADVRATPIKDKNDVGEAFSNSSSESYPEKKALSEGTSTAPEHEYHLDPYYLSSNLQPSAQYWGGTGVHNMQAHDHGGMECLRPNALGRQSHSSLDVDSPMSQG